MSYWKKINSGRLQGLRSSLVSFTIFLTVMLFSFLIAGSVFAAEANKLPQISPELSDGNDRCIGFLSTDKPIYSPGETLYARGVFLHADNYFPVKSGNAIASFRVTGPRDEQVFTSYSRLIESTAGFSWTIPANLAGGRYKATVAYNGNAPSERSFEIRVFAPPRLKSQIEFLREGYGPGDNVSAVLNVNRAEGGVPTGAKVTAIARLDGQEVARIDKLSVDAEGNCRADFKLPESIVRGEGSLAFLIEDGGVVETASKSLPILLQTLDLAFYPEGGDLVANLPTRLFIEAKRPDGKPADLAGNIIVVNDKDQDTGESPAAQISTVHEGRGLVPFTPDKGKRYALRLTEPAGIDRLFPLPMVKSSGAVISADKDAYDFSDPISLTVYASPDSGAQSVSLYHREKQIVLATVKAGENKLNLDPGDSEGVLMATVWDKNGNPLAERLIFRKPKFNVDVKISVVEDAKQGSPIPGAKVNLKIETFDAKGQPVEAVVGLSVTDDAVLEMVETRDKAPSLPVMVYLENEVKDLADAEVYFDKSNPDADRDINLLLATQGWRRFILVNLDKALKDHPEAATRAMAIRKEVIKPVMPAPADLMRKRNMEENVVFDGIDVKLKGQFDFTFNMQNQHEMAIADMDNAKQAGDEVQIMEQDMAAPIIALPAPAQGVAIKEERAMPYEVGIREYAHQTRINRKPNDRIDFSQTIYWNAGIRTNPRDGTAKVSFALSDSVTTFKVRADAFGNNGALGCGATDIISVEPFYIEPKIPPLAMAGDTLLIPVSMINSSGKSLEKPNMVYTAEGLTIKAPNMPGSLPAGSRPRTLLELSGQKAAAYELTLNVAADGYTDRVTRKISLLPLGFPMQLTASGIVGPAKAVSKKVSIPADIGAGSLKVTAKIYPSPLANMEEALNALLRQPYGCFEQTSSTSFPLVMAQQYFMSHSGVSPDKIKKAGALLEQSYHRLVGFECKDKGYEWFGGKNPGHEALTAYGLMQFKEMSKVMPVDSQMLGRTQKWLLDRRDGQGGFKRNTLALDSFGGAPAPLTNIYILWTLLESGEKADSLQKEITAAKKLTADTKDPYLLALGANVLYLAYDPPAAKAAAKALVACQDKDGFLKGAATSITRSGGESLTIETSALAVIAWLRCGEEFTEPVEKAMKWLFENCKAGRFGSTQSTILALKAINAYDAARSQLKKPGKARLYIDGKAFGSELSFDKESKGAVELPDFAAALSPGEHLIEIKMDGGNDMPYALEIYYTTSKPDSSPKCPLLLSTKLSTNKTAEGELVDLEVSVTAKDAEVPMPLAIIGLPAGTEPRHERLKELIAAKQIAAYEIIGRELVLYWRNLKPGENVKVLIPLTADIPGTFTAPASRVYGYYLEEDKNWVAGERIEITAR